ncbi:pyridoxamine 5'-phosphate oxidase family protein [Luteimonas arsenica]|uniref:pyridoxamine 5'-phosphate oxidase family protein n=1 Tax=Luteimonas arsenica TaxID=1586242 RepID=UPI00105601D4|nr:pyridoxamine 5'-phosphate oxidase family protein [Luteimonas arsenica]
MSRRFADLMFTPAVRGVQSEQGSRQAYERFDAPDSPALDRFSFRESEFIATRDSLYLASVSETGWPYVQHRGGPPGFIKVLDEQTLGLADYRGNRQYVSVGNVRGDDRVSLILVDYVQRRRLKIVGRMRVIDRTDSDRMDLLRDQYHAEVERGLIITLEGFDWNCPQHITPRYTEAELITRLAPVYEHIASLERQNAALLAKITDMELRGMNR